MNRKRWGNTALQKFYDSAKWKKCRAVYLNEHPYCERCASVDKVVPSYNVHHIEHLTIHTVNDPEQAYGFDNLEALCHECHYKEHYGRNDTGKGYSFDADGNLIYTPRS